MQDVERHVLESVALNGHFGAQDAPQVEHNAATDGDVRVLFDRVASLVYKRIDQLSWP